MNYTILLLIIGSLFIIGCSALEKKKTLPPSVSTSLVIQSLNDTKTELKEAGEQNTKVAKNIEKALSLAERLDLLLEEIEKEQRKNNKNIIKPLQ
jgi:redox-regulated HSP33 family molecular chaperone